MMRIACAVILVALVGSAEAVSVLNNSSVIFSDDFESQTLGSFPTGGSPGNWQTTQTNGDSASAFFVRDDATPGTLQGSKYLEVAQFVGGTNSSGEAHFATLQTSGAMHLQFMLYYPSTQIPTGPAIAQSAPGIRWFDSGGGTQQVNVFTQGGNLAYVTDNFTKFLNFKDDSDNNLPVARDVWQQIDIFHTLGTSVVTAQIDGGEVGTGATQTGAASTNVQHILFATGNRPGQYYLDSVVPEPSSLLLLTVGLVGLVGSRRRRKQHGQ